MSTPVTLPPPAAQTVLLESHLRRLRLPAMLAAYPKLSQEAAQAGLRYEQFLLALAEQEVTQRDEHMQRRRLSAAHFPALKTLDQYDFSLMPSLNKQLVLELAQATIWPPRKTFSVSARSARENPHRDGTGCRPAGRATGCAS
jgi:DNA replication protein DnaC